MTHSKSRPRMAKVAMALGMLLTIPIAGCNVDKLLSVTDPDIINPSDLRSPAGAEAERIGALARLNQATSGAESFFLYGGLMGDEWRSGDTFIERNQTDQRSVATNNANINTAVRILNRARVSAYEAHEALKRYAPDTPKWEIAEMYVVEAYAETMLAENLCNGIPLSYVLEGSPTFGKPLTTTQVYQQALAHYDTALTIANGTTTNDQDVQNKAKVGRARVLLNLARFPEALTATAGVPAGFKWNMEHAQTTRDNIIWSLNISGRRYTVAENEGPLGPNYQTANDPRVPTCKGATAGCPATKPNVFDAGAPWALWAQKIWPTRSSSVTISSGVEARLIRAEALMQAGNLTYLDTLNALRATVSLAPLTDPGTATGRVDQLFRERAFWLFSTGHRLPDMRRLLRAPYGRTQDQVFPTGVYPKGGNYGTDVNFPMPQSEENNPNFHGCLDRNA